MLLALGIIAVAHSLTKEVRGLQADSPTDRERPPETESATGEPKSELTK
jgi:hypothetical protein